MVVVRQTVRVVSRCRIWRNLPPFQNRRYDMLVWLFYTLIIIWTLRRGSRWDWLTQPTGNGRMISHWLSSEVRICPDLGGWWMSWCSSWLQECFALFFRRRSWWQVKVGLPQKQIFLIWSNLYRKESIFWCLLWRHLVLLFSIEGKVLRWIWSSYWCYLEREFLFN